MVQIARGDLIRGSLKKISEAKEIRHASDYDDFYIASREEAERQIAVADEFIQRIEKYCKEQIN